MRRKEREEVGEEEGEATTREREQKKRHGCFSFFRLFSHAHTLRFRTRSRTTARAETNSISNSSLRTTRSKGEAGRRTSPARFFVDIVSRRNVDEREKEKVFFLLSLSLSLSTTKRRKTRAHRFCFFFSSRSLFCF